jgi:hypothetical protein
MGGKKSKSSGKTAKLRTRRRPASFETAMRAVTDLLDVVLNSRVATAFVVGCYGPAALEALTLWLRR